MICGRSALLEPSGLLPPSSVVLVVPASDADDTTCTSSLATRKWCVRVCARVESETIFFAAGTNAARTSTAPIASTMDLAAAPLQISNWERLFRASSGPPLPQPVDLVVPAGTPFLASDNRWWCFCCCLLLLAVASNGTVISLRLRN